MGSSLNIIGNGPSARDVKWSSICKSRYTFTCNNFAKAKEPIDVQPLLYFLGDPDYADISTYQPGAQAECLLEKISKYYSYTTIFTSSSISDAIDLYARLSPSISPADLRIIHAVFRGGNPLGPFDYKISNGLEQYQNILVLMLQVAVFLGFSDIRLYGFEFSSILTYPLRNGRHHFYSTNNENQWKGADNSIKPVDQLEFFRSSYLTLCQLMSIQNYAKNNSITITNHTPGTLLKTFPGP